MFSPASIIGWRPLVIASAILVGLAFSPGRANAGCGDYASMPDHHSQLGRLLKDKDQSPVKPRCHGPNCSQSPPSQAPLRDAPVRVVSADNDLTCFPFDSTRFLESSRPLPADQDDPSPAGPALFIFHPPR